MICDTCRCTVRSACQQASQSLPRWLSYGAGQQCIDFEQVSPDRIPINQLSVVSGKVSSFECRSREYEKLFGILKISKFFECFREFIEVDIFLRCI